MAQKNFYDLLRPIPTYTDIWTPNFQKNCNHPKLHPYNFFRDCVPNSKNGSATTCSISSVRYSIL